MLQEERRSLIVDFVNKNKSASVYELKKILRVSEVTVRKELQLLDEQGLLKRTHGGALSLSSLVAEYTEMEKKDININEKKAIAKAAYDLIKNSDTVFLDSGTTTLELARLIFTGLKSGMIIITNSFAIINVLISRPDLELVFVGGCVRNKMMSCVGSIAEDIISSLVYDKVFMGANAVSIENGTMTPNLYEASIKRKMVQFAQHAFLLCDSSKIGCASMAKICPLKSFDAIITDAKVPAQFKNACEKMNIKVIKTGAE